MNVRRLAYLAWPPLTVFAGVFAMLEVAVRAGWIASFLVPRPSDAIKSLGANFAEIAGAFMATASAALRGFGLSVAVGVVVAVALSSGGLVRRAFYPYAVFFQTVPIIAVAPLLVIWFGFDQGAVIASAFVASVFPVIANTLSGLMSVDAPLVDLFRLYRARPLAALVKLRLPFALPQIFTGLRVAAGLSVIGAIVGEFITGSGLGGLIQVARQQRKIDKVFATLLVTSLLGVAMFAMINAVARLTLRHWHASERTEGA
ncbi:MAG TPA: ABC transporter permease [Tepidisphaeraceae bacterium]|jgi:NitT/TauT family transport system permease protein